MPHVIFPMLCFFWPISSQRAARRRRPANEEGPTPQASCRHRPIKAPPGSAKSKHAYGPKILLAGAHQRERPLIFGVIRFCVLIDFEEQMIRQKKTVGKRQGCRKEQMLKMIRLYVYSWLMRADDGYDVSAVGSWISAVDCTHSLCMASMYRGSCSTEI